MEPFRFRAGNTPVLISIPHNGSWIPDSIAATMTPEGRSSRDTDWFLDRLYALLETSDASFLIAEYSRYVIDLNRPQDDTPLYPGLTTTGLIPTIRFDGQPIYITGNPDEQEIANRVQSIWSPYHRTLENELSRLVNRFGIAVLIEAHSIASVVPLLFPGVLPDFNIGTNAGLSADPSLAQAIISTLESAPEYSQVLNGRFVGGYITRHYGQPQRNVHAVQLELSQATYLDERTLAWSNAKAAKVQTVFSSIFSAINTWVKQR